MLTWIHGDEVSTGPDEVDLAALEDEACGAGRQGWEDGEDLLGNHRQYLDVDTVKLVKTAPRSSLKWEW